ncbi:MAG TPA: PRC-barrel domain-containing protein [Pseudolabrys sp.]|nr:PRC-barrel domain-containing protein [Pseudolabrys sp.]
MLKKLMLGTAVSALMLSGAMAQTPNAPSSPASPPPSSAAPTTPPAAKAPDTSGKASDTSKSADASTKKATFVSTQQPDQLLVSKFKGTDVLGSDGKSIGDVSDILFDKSGKIEAYVISVGGFLGVGSKSVAMPPSSFEVVPGQNGASPKLKTAMTKDQLKQAQNFKPYEPPRATTGSGGGLGGAKPAGGKPAGMH